MFPYSTVFFDVGGVLCQDLIYPFLKESNPAAHDVVEEDIFGENKDIFNKRMKNILTTKDINKYISMKSGMDYETLQNMLDTHVKNMTLDVRLLQVAQALKEQGVHVAIVTNNMDFFNEVLVPKYSLHNIFSVIVNSSDHGILKTEEDGKLFDIAMEQVGEVNYNKTLLIDDSASYRQVFEKKGGCTYAYTNYEDFMTRYDTVK